MMHLQSSTLEEGGQPPAIPFAHIMLKHFRCHHKVRWTFPLAGETSAMMAVLGPNGAGKTSVLEALSLFSPGRGLRASTLGDFQKHEILVQGHKENFPHPDQRTMSDPWRVALALHTCALPLMMETYGLNSGRKILVNGASVGQNALHEWLHVVWPLPLAAYTSGQKRAYLNRLTYTQVPEYAVWIQRYDQALRQRNALLHRQERDLAWYRALEEILVQKGTLIHQARQWVLARLRHELHHHITPLTKPSLMITGDVSQALHLVSDGDFDPWRPGTDPEAQAVYQETYRERLSAMRGGDMQVKQTRFGIHRCAFHITYSPPTQHPRDIALCSMGEQKSLLLSLTIASLRLLRQKDSLTPVFVLMDEIMTHLDAVRQDWIWQELRALGVTLWMSALEGSAIPKDVLPFYLPQ